MIEDKPMNQECELLLCLTPQSEENNLRRMLQKCNLNNYSIKMIVTIII